MNIQDWIPKSPIKLFLLGVVCGAFLLWLFGGGGGASGEAEVAGPSAPSIWTCSMHPNIQQPDPGLCPICAMDLIPLDDMDEADDEPRRFSMSEAAKQLARIQTAPVERRYEEKILRMVGKVTYDETRTRYITAWFPGRLDRLFVNVTGTPVKQGDHLAEMYSPDIISDQEALLQARRAVDRSGGADLLARARERLRLLGVSDAQIEEIERRGTASDRITFYSPIDGIVTQRAALEGEYVQTGTRIYSIADLTHLWVMMDAYESDLQWIRYGQDVEFTTVSYPGEVFHGRVSFITPFLDPSTRTVKVRVNVDNPDGKLKPDMFVNATVRSLVTSAGAVISAELDDKWICYMHPEVIQDEPGECDICHMDLVPSDTMGYARMGSADAEEPLLIPASAALITGTRAVVYVEVPGTERPTFDGRVIELGPRVGDYYVVKSGLKEGERVVVNGAFKIDSALQIQAKPSMMSPGIDELEDEDLPILTPDDLRELTPFYLRVSNELANDDYQAAHLAFHEYMETVETPGDEIGEALEALHMAPDIERAREAFHTVSRILIASVMQHGAPVESLYEAHCPMAFNDQGASWLQTEEAILNPYFGATMLRCGVIDAVHPVREPIPSEALQPLLNHYRTLWQSLADDDWDSSREAAQTLHQTAQDASAPEAFLLATESAAAAEDIESLRSAFEPISNQLITAVTEHGAPEETLYEAHCPMAFDDQGASWLQWDESILNPYFGATMLRCGVIETVHPVSELISPEALPALLDAYKPLWQALANDEWVQSRDNAHALYETARQAGTTEAFIQAAELAANAEDIEALRATFQPISDQLIEATALHGAPEGTLYEAYCPMAFDDQGASWLQWDDRVFNPYFGARMLRCGVIEREIAAHATAESHDDHAHH